MRDARRFELDHRLLKRVCRCFNLRMPIRTDHQQGMLTDAAGQVVEHIDRGGIRPVQILEYNDRGPALSHGIQHLRVLAQHALPRGDLYGWLRSPPL